MYKLILAFRYLIKRRISYFALFAVSLCVFVVLVVMTVLNGLTSEFKEKMHRITGDCVVSSKSLAGFAYYEEFSKILERQDIVEAISPVIKTYSIVKSNAFEKISQEQVIKIIGIYPEMHNKTTGFANYLCYANFTDVNNIFAVSPDTNMPGCVAGIAVLFSRNSSGSYNTPDSLIPAAISFTCFPLTAKGTLAQAGTGVVESKTFLLKNLIQTGTSADWENMYLPFNDAQIISGLIDEPKRASEIHIKFRKGIEINDGCAQIASLWQKFAAQNEQKESANLFKNVSVQNWKDFNRAVIAVAETQEALMIIVFAMIGIITVFIVFVVFYMIVSHKSKDIGVLKSVGASNSGMMGVFMLFAFWTGLIGSIIGSLAGWFFLAYINQIENWLYVHFDWQLYTRSMYFINQIPNRIDLLVLSGIILSAIAACLIGAVVPALQAARLDPVKQLQVSRL